MPASQAPVLVLAVFVACMTAGAGAMSAAAEGGLVGQTELDTTWMTTPRDLTFVRGQNGFHWTSVLQEEDVIRGSFDIGEAKYRMTFSPTDTEEMVSLDLDVTIQALIEFEDEDRDGAYDVGERTYQRIRLTDFDQAEMEVSPYYDEGQRITVRYTLEPPGDGQLPLNDEEQAPPAVLTLTFYVLPDVRSVEGAVVHPTQSRFDIGVEDFPWQSNGSMLALHTRAGSDGVVEASDGDFLATQAGLFAVTYRWAPDASVDGTHVTVESTMLSYHDGSQDVIFAYPHGSDIIHDPMIGSERHIEQTIIEDIQTAITEGDPLVYGLGLFASALLIGGVTYYRLRQSA